MKLLVIDNYDSFTYNLVHLLTELGQSELDVYRNDKISPQEALRYDKILLSPGPGIPSEAGNMPEIIKACAPTKNILGVCLGHQGLAEYFGAKLLNLSEVFHGKETPIKLYPQKDSLFTDLPEQVQAGRYHSWVVEKQNLPPELLVTAEDQQGQLMAFKHKDLNVRGIQFHPESIMTSTGKKMLENWLRLS